MQIRVYNPTQINKVAIQCQQSGGANTIGKENNYDDIKKV